MVDEKILDYDYFKKRTPFKRVLNKFCDLFISMYREGSYSYSNVCHCYTISYDMGKFIDNLDEIKKSLLKTKYAKNLSDVREKLLIMPSHISEFKNVYEINRFVSDLIIMGCIPDSEYSQRFIWDVKNSLSNDAKYNIECAQRMEQPIIRFMEINAYERECWNFYFNFPSDIEYSLLKKLQKRLLKIEKEKSEYGNSYIELKFIPENYKDINWDSKATSYMRRNNYISGNLNLDLLKELLEYSDKELFAYLYKGGVKQLFNNG